VIAATSIAAALLLSAVRVEGATTCPKPSDVEALLLRHDGAARLDDRADLVVSGGLLEVRLVDGAGAPINQRTLQLDAPCSSLAEAAAAVIDAMELELRRGPRVDIGNGPRLAEAPRPPEAATRTVSAPTPQSPVTYSISAAFLESLAGDALAPAAALTLGLGSGRSPFLLEAGLSLEAGRQLTFDRGAASYQRFWISLGPGYALRWAHFGLEAEVLALGGLVAVAGDGRSSPASETALQLGVGAGLTARWSIGLFGLSTGPLVLLWPGAIDVQIVSLGQTRPLPLWDALWGVGVRFGSG